MQPTPRADMLIDSVRATLRSLQRLSTPPGDFEPLNSNRTFRIAMADGSHITLLPRLLKEVRAMAPMVCLETFAMDRHVSALLQSGQVDLAIGVTAELEPDLYQQTFYDQDFVCLLGRNHELARKALTLPEYLQESHVGVSAGMSSDLLDAALKAERVQRRVILRLPGFLGLAPIVADTDLIATVPRQIGEVLATRSPGLCTVPCPVQVPAFSVRQVWHMRMHHDPANRWLRKLCAATLTT
jgi:DNA-binding transcriptional LysR family regulator